MQKDCPQYLTDIVNRRPKPELEPPEDIVKFRLKPREQRYRDSEEFYRRDHIREYLEDKWRRELYNRDTLINLLRERTENKANPAALKEINAAVMLFYEAIKQTRYPYEALLVDWETHGLDVANHKTNSREINEIAWND